MNVCRISLQEARKALIKKKKILGESNQTKLNDMVDHYLPTYDLIAGYWSTFKKYKQSKNEKWKQKIEKIVKIFCKQIRSEPFVFNYKISNGLTEKPYTNESEIHDCIYFWFYKGYIIKIGRTKRSAFKRRMESHLNNVEDSYYLTQWGNVTAPNHNNISNVIYRMHKSGVIKQEPDIKWFRKNLKRIDLFIKPKHKNERLLIDIENYFHRKIMPFYETHFNDNYEEYIRKINYSSHIIAFKSVKVYRKYLRKQYCG